MGSFGVIKAATTLVEGFWGVGLSQQEKGHGGGGATMSSDRGWTGLGTENLWSGLSDGRQSGDGGDGGEGAGHTGDHRPND